MDRTGLMTAAWRSVVFPMVELPGSALNRAAALSMPLTWSLRQVWKWCGGSSRGGPGCRR